MHSGHGMRSPEETVTLDQFDYALPPELIAQTPADQRDQSRLLVTDRVRGTIDHRRFCHLPSILRPDDVLVINDSRVFPARFRGRKRQSAGAIEILLVEELAQNRWWVMLKPGKRVRVGTQVELTTPDGNPSGVTFTIKEKNEEGHCLVEFTGTESIVGAADELGEIPLPPYITPACDRRFDDRTRYQTVYANEIGSVAAPTAGLHFTPSLLEQLGQAGIQIVRLTLHVGTGTFAPVKTAQIDGHRMHSEQFQIGEIAAETLNQARAQGRRIIAVGTTSLRVLESAVKGKEDVIHAQRGSTDIFIYPPHSFHVVDALITNFHLPKSTLLMLVSALAAPGDTAGIAVMQKVYSEAIQHRYRFFSYGDAMLIQ